MAGCTHGNTKSVMEDDGALLLCLICGQKTRCGPKPWEWYASTPNTNRSMAMAKVTITFEDTDGGMVGMNVDRHGLAFDKDSRAHQMANGVLNYLDRLQAQSAPQMIHTAQDINQRRAQQVAHIAQESVIIHAH